MDLYDIAIARKLSSGGGGGGGGDSDFSTATMTFVGSDLPDELCGVPVLFYSEDYGKTILTDDGYWGGNLSFTVPLYKGELYIALSSTDGITITGNATVDDMAYLIVTGDCTITIS